MFENYRHFLASDEEQLLIEGRETDAMDRVIHGFRKTNVNVREELQSLMNQYLDLDKEQFDGRQKYALWIAKHLSNAAIDGKIEAEDAPALDKLDIIKNKLFRMHRRLLRRIPQYHELANRNLINKDINSFKEPEDFSREVELAWNRLEIKKKKEEQRADAKENSAVIDNNEDFRLVRPLTHGASCYWGTTAWCISRVPAEDETNWFHEYTSEGKTFYMVDFKHLPEGNTNKKMTLVYFSENKREPGKVEPDNFVDLNNEVGGVDEEEFREAVRSNILLKGVKATFDNAALKVLAKDYKKNYTTILDDLVEQYENLYITDPDPEDYKSLFQAAKGHGHEPEDIEELQETLEELTSEEYWTIIGQAHGHYEKNPAKIPENLLQSIVDKEGPWEHVSIWWDDYGNGLMFNASVRYMYPDIELIADVDTGKIFNIIAGISSVYPQDVEFDPSDGALQIDVQFGPGNENHNVSAFKEFVEDMSHHIESDYESDEKSIANSLKESGLTLDKTTAETLEHFENLNFKNLEVDLEEDDAGLNRVTINAFFLVKILLPQELRFGSRVKPADELSAFLYRRLSEELALTGRKIEKQVIGKIKTTLDKALDAISKQTKLPLGLGFSNVGAHVQIPEYNLGFGGGFDRSVSQGSLPHHGEGFGEYEIADRRKYWLEIQFKGEENEDDIKIIERFAKVLDQDAFYNKLFQYVEALINNEVQREIIPKIRKEFEDIQKDMQNQEKTVDQLSQLFEGWRKFIK